MTYTQELEKALDYCELDKGGDLDSVCSPYLEQLDIVFKAARLYLEQLR
jgi:hypothetical protein